MFNLVADPSIPENEVRVSPALYARVKALLSPLLTEHAIKSHLEEHSRLGMRVSGGAGVNYEESKPTVNKWYEEWN